MPKLDLVKSALSYKINIPLYVEKKIRILCREIHNIEWSGILFYRVNGSFEDGTLEVDCVDIYQMDEGSTGYTEFDMSADVMNYMVEHPELISEDIFQGLIHSHNNMSTFFSGTDTGTLLAEGSDVNHFVSLIVNNAGVYTAGITRRVSVVQKVSEEYTYPSWKDSEKTGTREFTATKTYVQWFNLVVNKDEVAKEDESEILNRIKEVRKLKASKPKYSSKLGSEDLPKATPVVVKPTNIVPATPTTPKKEDKPKNTEVTPSLFELDEEEYDVNYNLYHYSDDTIISIVKQLITLSLVLPNSDAIDAKEWAKNMDEIFDARFGDVVEFETVAVNIVDYLLNYTEEEEAFNHLTPRESVAVLANEVKGALAELPENKYINSLMSICDDYIF